VPKFPREAQKNLRPVAGALAGNEGEYNCPASVLVKLSVTDGMGGKHKSLQHWHPLRHRDQGSFRGPRALFMSQHSDLL